METTKYKETVSETKLGERGTTDANDLTNAKDSAKAESESEKEDVTEISKGYARKLHTYYNINK